MYFKLQQSKILRVENTFATLKNVVDNKMQFEFRYFVNQQSVISKNAYRVKISVVTKIIRKSQSNSNNDAKTTIKNVINQSIDAKNLAKEQSGFVLSTKFSDISAHINNGNINALRNGQLGEKTHLVPKLVQDIKVDNENLPLLQYIAYDTTSVFSGSNSSDPQKIALQMLLAGHDPSSITKLTHRSIPAISVLGGLLRPQKMQETQFGTFASLLNFYILNEDKNSKTTLDVSDETFINVFERTVVDDLEIPVMVKIPIFSDQMSEQLKIRNLSIFNIKFDLLDSNDGIIDTITKQLDTEKHLQLFNTPRKPPIIHASKSESAEHTNLYIRQIDPVADSILLYKKSINKVVHDEQTYSLIGSYQLLKQQSMIVPVEKPTHSTFVYRAIPVGRDGTVGFEFENIVINPTVSKPIKRLSLTTTSTELGVQIEIRDIPIDVVSIQILVRNLSTNENLYRHVSQPILIDESTKISGIISVNDVDVTSDKIYEYAAKLIYASGSHEIVGNSIIEFVRLKPGKVDLRITNLSMSFVDNEIPNVTFDITSNVIDENIDIVLTLLRRQDISEFFNDDVAKEREFLKSLIAHNVQRVDLTTGTREDFGVIIDEQFDDHKFGKNMSVTPLVSGRKYRYEVSTLLRAPETMFETFEKEMIDSTTKKKFKFKPAKFLHPVTLTKGTIVSATGLRTRFAKQPMTHGTIGTMESIEVSFDFQQPKVTDLSVEQVTKNVNVISWQVNVISLIDHFLIFKDVHSVRTLIGKVHSGFEFGNCKFIHALTSKDTGEMKYIIQPVFNDYKPGMPFVSNSIIVQG